MRTVALLLLVLPGCSYDFDEYLPTGEPVEDSQVADAIADTSVACTDTDGQPFAGHCYFPITTGGRFDDMRAACGARGAHLVTITSEAEETFVETIRPGRERWIGLRRVLPSTMYTWTTGEALGYTKWASGEPNESGECVRIRAASDWADQGCNNSVEAICERE